ncbi:hypothetical protein CMI37_00600 [Candidatus Pacearchaeota archaeon]|nr:hypothetical protein [Candidatus Pacearchaeota archaeon]
MALEDVKQEAELYIASLQDAIVPLQATYIGSNGQYWQGIETPRPVPSDGDDGIPDPHIARDSLPTWDDFGLTLPATAPFAISVNEQSYPGTYRAYDLLASFDWGPGTWTGRVTYSDGAWGDLGWAYHQWPPA